jgi:hypothetical protein
MNWLLAVVAFVLLIAVGLVVVRMRRPAGDPRLAAFHREVEAACEAADAGALDRLRAEREALGLDEDDAAIELEMLDGLADLLAFTAEVARDGLPDIETQHRVLGTDRCHFWTPAFLPDRVEAGGKLFFTEHRVVFVGGGVTSVPWSGVTRVARDGRDLVLVVPSRDAAYRFRCNAFSEALRGRFVADRLVSATRARRAAGGAPRPNGGSS